MHSDERGMINEQARSGCKAGQTTDCAVHMRITSATAELSFKMRPAA